MKNITVSVTDEAYREARVWAAQRDTSLSKAVQYFITTLPGLKPAARKFLLPDTGTSAQNSTSSAESSANKPTFAAQSSAPEPTS